MIASPGRAHARAVRRRLLERGYHFDVRQSQYRMAFHFADGAVLNIYSTQTVQWQGRPSPARDDIEALIWPKRASLWDD